MLCTYPGERHIGIAWKSPSAGDGLAQHRRDLLVDSSSWGGWNSIGRQQPHGRLRTRWEHWSAPGVSLERAMTADSLRFAAAECVTVPH